MKITVDGRSFDDIYPEEFYTKYKKEGDPYIEGARVLASVIYRFFKPKSVIDCGCAIGAELLGFKQLGVEVKGLDGSKYAVKHRLVPEVEQWDLRVKYPFKRKYDICLCFETIEHIRQEYEHIVLENITSASDVVMISVPYRVGGSHHVNEQPPEYWVNRFKSLGYSYDGEMVKNIQVEADIEAKGWCGKGWVLSRLQIFRRNKK